MDLEGDVVISKVFDRNSTIDRERRRSHNLHMDISGHIQNGVVVLDSPVILAEGTAVTVTVRSEPRVHVAPRRKRVAFPLVSSNAPGSVHLTNQQIAEILDEEDAAS